MGMANLAIRLTKIFPQVCEGLGSNQGTTGPLKDEVDLQSLFSEHIQLDTRSFRALLVLDIRQLTSLPPPG